MRASHTLNTNYFLPQSDYCKRSLKYLNTYNKQYLSNIQGRINFWLLRPSGSGHKSKHALLASKMNKYSVISVKLNTLKEKYQSTLHRL